MLAAGFFARPRNIRLAELAQRVTMRPCWETPVLPGSRQTSWRACPPRPRRFTAGPGSSTRPCARSPSAATARPPRRRSPSGRASRHGRSSTLFAGKEEALIWAYDVAAAYVVPQVLRALRAEPDWERGATAALSTYLTILDCDSAWAIACLRDIPAAGRARAGGARRGPRAGPRRACSPGIPSGCWGCGHRDDPDGHRRDRRRRAAPLARPAAGCSAGASWRRWRWRRSPTSRRRPTWRPRRCARRCWPPRSRRCWTRAAEARSLELLVREAVDLRDGPTLWQVIAVLQRRGAAAIRRCAGPSGSRWTRSRTPGSSACAGRARDGVERRCRADDRSRRADRRQEISCRNNLTSHIGPFTVLDAPGLPLWQGAGVESGGRREALAVG